MLSSNTISCACPPAYMGDRCQTLNPCRNPICVQGLCQINPITQGAQCACYAGWTGTFCDISIPCSSNPCVYGTCIPSGTSGYICNCLPGYYGPQCQFPIVQTPCQSNPCRNGGTCQLTPTNGYVCSCPASFVGTNCEFINPCLLIGASPSCQPVLTPFGNYTCSCPTNPVGEIRFLIDSKENTPYLHYLILVCKQSMSIRNMYRNQWRPSIQLPMLS